MAVDLEPAERATSIDRACGDDEGLRREVLSLIEAHEEADHFLEQPPLERSPLEPLPLERPGGGGRIGPYEVVRELGRGGMGTVYLTLRPDDPRSRKFAVKVINADVACDLAIGRFNQERRILATLGHPNIARYLDGGTMEDGRPFLVMEYVDGEPIDRYCDRHRLDLVARIKLFLAICSAIQYAHQKLVIHRDLKPGNVLVKQDGTVKVLDFGTAKLLDPALRLPGLTSTVTGLCLMTPGYASPEQIRGEPITTMSDVYGLGALLYELLCGHRAHRFLSAHPAEVVRVVCEEAPQRPSSVVGTQFRRSDSSTTGFLPPEILAEWRSTQVLRWQRRLAGDLDKILLKALHKEPERRYGSVEQLSGDLWRHLAGMPVLASRGSLVYRGRKFLQRHRTLATASAIASISLLALAVSLMQPLRQSGDPPATLEGQKAQHVSAFLVDLDTASSLHQLGLLYLQQSRYGDAEPLMLRALGIREAALGAEHLMVASTLDDLSRLRHAQGRSGEAGTLLQRALEIRRRALGESHPATLATVERLAAAGG